MHSVVQPSVWIALLDTLAIHGLSGQVSHSAPDASWLHYGGLPDDAPSEAAFNGLVPGSYLAFVADHGYPLLAAPSQLHYAFAFLPPLAARQVSALLADEEMGFEEASAARRAGDYVWRHVMFAGWNFADGDGWAFGADSDAEDDDAEPLVWLVEGGEVVEVVGTFEEWLQERADDVRNRLAALDAKALAATVAREGDYAYGPMDLEGFDG